MLAGATFTKLLRFLIPASEGGDRRHVSDRLSVVLHTNPLAKKFLAPAVMQVGAPRTPLRHLHVGALVEWV